MRCPECNKMVKPRSLTKCICKSCGYIFTIKDFFKPNWKCPMFDICNFADKCNDNDWEGCGAYQSFMGHIKDMKFGYDLINQGTGTATIDLNTRQVHKTKLRYVSGDDP